MRRRMASKVVATALVRVGERADVDAGLEVCAIVADARQVRVPAVVRLPVAPLVRAVSWHRDGAGSWQGEFGEQPSRPHAGFASREEETNWIRATTGGRPFAITECGWSTAPRCWGWWIFRQCRRWTDDQVLLAAVDEYALWKDAGAELMVLYQINDGPSDTRLNRYGIRRADGSWKPVAELPRLV
jgi:hypothetical protein